MTNTFLLLLLLFCNILLLDVVKGFMINRIFFLKTGGFMSHCGWGSCKESITMGVPIATWPMHSDQPNNAFLVTDILKVGLVVDRWEDREELVSSSAIARTVKRLMTSKEGEEIRKRAAELGSASRRSVEEGGVSRLELDSFVSHITR